MEERILTLKEMQQLELNILREIHRLCEENGLKYILGYGSAIGAVRHRGFIPWDDDIDLCMPYPDYLKLAEIMNEANGRYRMLCREYDSDYIYPFAKVVDTNTELYEYETVSKPIGVFVDIFPVYGTSSKKAGRFMDIYRALLNEKLCVCARLKEPVKEPFLKRFIQKMLMPAAKRKGIEKLNSKTFRFASKYPYEDSSFAGYIPSGFALKDIFAKEIFEERKTVPFENCKFYISEHYDEYLKALYGNYMKLPPEDERISHHRFNVKFIDGQE